MEEPLVDHKGRSRPLYRRKTARPHPSHTWRPGRLARWLLGLVPGLRLLLLHDARGGTFYAAAGSLSAFGALYLAIRWKGSAETIERLLIDPRWMMLHAGVLLLLVIGVELSRAAAANAEPNPASRSHRLLAGLLVPCALVVVSGPALLGYWPLVVETVWLAACALGLIALWAATCVIVSPPRRRGVSGGGVLALVLILTATLVVPGARAAVAEWASTQGFSLLPTWLSSPVR